MNVSIFLMMSALLTVVLPLRGMSTNPGTDPVLSLHWELLSNQSQPAASHQARFTITNQGNQALAPGWTLYFNAIYVNVRAESLTPSTKLEHLSGDFFRFTTDPSAPALAPGESIHLEYRSGGMLMKNVQVPEGAYFVKAGDTRGVEFASFTYTRLEIEDQQALFEGTSRPVPDAGYLFDRNQGTELLAQSDLPPVLPTPVSWLYEGGRTEIHLGLWIGADQKFGTETDIFADAAYQLTSRLPGGAIHVETNFGATSAPDIENSIGTGLFPVLISEAADGVLHPEGFTLEIGVSSIHLQASGNAGVFYGLQTLLSMLAAETASILHDAGEAAGRLISLPRVTIEDAPRFGYRGLFLDIARNYQQPEDIRRLIDLMAFYKFNVLQLHLANDEAWRIEIPGLPELTTFGSRRGHGDDETRHQWPYYGSGPDPDNSTYGSGYLSRQEFIEILQYARDRHIEVIPEIVAPGHMKAAIYAMEYRFRRLMAQGDPAAASEFLLKHPQDTSEYVSVQRYRRNTMDVCMESSYRFYAHVTDALLDMYREAGVSIRTFHTGGDEVPRGVWIGSPACAELIASGEGPTGTQDLHNWFYRRLASMLDERGLQLAGWEEVGQVRVREGERYVYRPNRDLLGKGFRLHAWNAVVGWPGTDMAYQLANAGYEVVMSNSSNVYFDLAYDMHPDEPGLHWSGFVNLRSAWQLTPFNHFISNDADMQGNPVDAAALAATHEQLTEEGKARIVGLQGQLWTETVRGPDMMFYYLLPKMLGLAERAWSPDPEWSQVADAGRSRAMMLQDWNRFANGVGQRELPLLEILHGGYNTRIPRPGSRIIDGYLHANIETPGLIIRYTTDGTEPDATSPEYSGPLRVEEIRAQLSFEPELEAGAQALTNQPYLVQFRAFTPSGHHGRVTRLWID